MKPGVRWGILGCGGIAARRTIPEVQNAVPNAGIVSVMDTDLARSAAVARQFHVPHACATIEELLAQEIDAVYVASPPHAHCDQVVRAAQSGRHVLCEKPMALSLEEVDRMAAAVNGSGVKFMLGFCMRFNPYHRKARDLVQAGTLGQMVMGRAELTCWYPPLAEAWRQDAALSGGGALIDMGTHCLDILEWIMGAHIVEVTGFQDLLTHRYRTPVEDASTVLVRFANGAHGIVDNYFNLPDAAAQNSLELHGTKGSLIGQGTIGQEPTGRMFSVLPGAGAGYDAKQARDGMGARVEYRLEGAGLYGQMIEAFSRCILEDREPPVTLADGLHSVRVTEAIYRAVRERRVVRVDEA